MSTGGITVLYNTLKDDLAQMPVGHSQKGKVQVVGWSDEQKFAAIVKQISMSVGKGINKYLVEIVPAIILKGRRRRKEVTALGDKSDVTESAVDWRYLNSSFLTNLRYIGLICVSSLIEISLCLVNIFDGAPIVLQ